jgi:Arylsulfotransferase (ASST)
MIERRLNGRPIRVLNTRGAPSDFHDVLLLPNGHYVLATIDFRSCDLAPWAQGLTTCAFHQFQELTRRGEVVWSWRPEDDIGIRQTPRKWRDERPVGAADPWHYNSIDWAGDGFIISFRHLDAVFKIDYASKDVVWKLGGTPRPRSLRVIGDPVFRAGGSISGQHDARLLRPRVLTLFDNGTGADRAPRSVVYRINERARTATMMRRVKDPIARTSQCCGSTRVLPGGNHVTGWGGTPWISENRPGGRRVFRLDANFVYRATPIVDRRYTRRELRAAMDAQYRNGVFAHGAAASVANPGHARLVDPAAGLGLPADAHPPND